MKSLLADGFELARKGGLLALLASVIVAAPGVTLAARGVGPTAAFWLSLALFPVYGVSTAVHGMSVVGGRWRDRATWSALLRLSPFFAIIGVFPVLTFWILFEVVQHFALGTSLDPGTPGSLAVGFAFLALISRFCPLLAVGRLDSTLNHKPLFAFSQGDPLLLALVAGVLPYGVIAAAALGPAPGVQGLVPDELRLGAYFAAASLDPLIGAALYAAILRRRRSSEESVEEN